MNLPDDASNDQSNCPDGYYRRNNGMVVQKPEQTGAVAVKSFIPDLTDDELRKLAKEKLSEALQAIDPQTQPELTRKLYAEVKDRLDGKPVASEPTTINVNANVLTTQQCLGIPLSVLMPAIKHAVEEYERHLVIDN